MHLVVDLFGLAVVLAACCNGPCIDLRHRFLGLQPHLHLRVGFLGKAAPAAVVGFTGIQNGGEALGATQGIATLQEIGHGFWPQLLGTVDVTVVLRHQQRQITALRGYPQAGA